MILTNITVDKHTDKIYVYNSANINLILAVQVCVELIKLPKFTYYLLLLLPFNLV